MLNSAVSCFGNDGLSWYIPVDDTFWAEIKPMEFVDDIADPSREKASAIASNSVLEAIQHEKRISFPAEKCELLKINCDNSDGLKVNGIGIKVVEPARYLGDLFNIKGDNSDTCRERHLKAKGTSLNCAH